MHLNIMMEETADAYLNFVTGTSLIVLFAINQKKWGGGHHCVFYSNSLAVCK